MNGRTKRGTHGLRKRCPLCKVLRRFARTEERRRNSIHNSRTPLWEKRGNRWVCGYCIARGVA